MKKLIKTLAMLAFMLLPALCYEAKAEITIKVDTIWSIVPSEKNYGNNAAFLQPTKDIDTTYVFFGGKSFIGGGFDPLPNDTTLCQVNNQTGEIIKVIAKVPSPQDCLRPGFVFMKDTNCVIGETHQFLPSPDYPLTFERDLAIFNIRTGKHEYIPSKPYNLHGFYISYIPEDDAILFQVPWLGTGFCKYNLKNKTHIPENSNELKYYGAKYYLSPDKRYLVVLAYSSTLVMPETGAHAAYYEHNIRNHLIDIKDMSIKHKFIDTTYNAREKDQNGNKHSPKRYEYCVISPDGRYLALVASKGYYSPGSNPYLEIFDLHNNMEKRKIEIPFKFNYNSIAIDSSNKYLFLSRNVNNTEDLILNLSNLKFSKLSVSPRILSRDKLGYGHFLVDATCKIHYTIIDNSDSSEVASPSETVNNASVYIQHSILHINSKEDNKLSDISIINLLGEELFQNQEVNSSILFPYPSGIYFIKIKINNKDKIFKVINF